MKNIQDNRMHHVEINPDINIQMIFIKVLRKYRGEQKVSLIKDGVCVWVELGISMRRMKLDSCLSPVAKHVEQMDLEFKYKLKITGLLEENKEKVLEWASNSFWTNIQMTKKKMSRGSFAMAEETVCRIEETHWK